MQNNEHLESRQGEVEVPTTERVFKSTNGNEQQSDKGCWSKTACIILIVGLILIGITLAIVLPLKLIDKETHDYLYVSSEEKKTIIDQYPGDKGGKTIYVTGHQNPDTDTITSAVAMANLEKAIGNKNNVIPIRLGEPNLETQFAFKYFKADLPILKTSVSDADGGVILVDHNDPAQGPADITEAKVIKIVDHHGLTYQTADPTYIYTRAAGCTGTILYGLYTQYNVPISKQLAGLMLSGIISDTVLLKSSTTTEEDKQTLQKLEKIAEVDAEKYGRDMLMAGTDFSGYTEKELLNLDAKNYETNGHKYFIACLNAVDVNSILNRKEKFYPEIDDLIQEKGYVLVVVSILDILNMDSYIFVRGEYAKAVETAFDVTLDGDEAFLKGINSRKKQIYPKIDAVLQTYSN